jgi:hypothetical protein
MAPREQPLPGTRPTETKEVLWASTLYRQPAIPSRQHPRTKNERPHACDDGWVTLGQIVVHPETGGETEEYAFYLCRRCAKRLGRMK